MTHAGKVSLSAVSLLLMAGPLFADELTKEKRADIEHLLAITGAMNLAQQTASFMSGQVIEALAKSNPKMPQRAVDLVREEVSAVLAENMPGLQEMIVSSYSAHFTRSEINDVVTFYETETGKKVIRVMPAVLQELMVTGKRWGQSLTPIAEKRISERLQREGFIPRK